MQAQQQLVDRLTPKIKEKLDAVFLRCDINGDGVISREELLAAFQDAAGRGSRAVKFFNVMDTDASGTVTKEEFMFFWAKIYDNGGSERDILSELDLVL